MALVPSTSVGGGGGSGTVTSVAAGDSSIVVGGTPTVAPTLTTPAGLGIYGDGSDGTVTFDGATTILGMVPAANIYTLTRDFFFAGVTINNGVTIKTNGYRLFVSGTLTGGGATAAIQWNGQDAAANVNGAAIQNTTATINAGNAANSPGTAGAAGGVGVGTAGTSYGAAGGRSLGAVGGSGGTGSGGAGGAGGTITTPGANQSILRSSVLGGSGFIFAAQNAAAPTLFHAAGGTGGGAGGGDGANSGGGGSGGAIVLVYAKTFSGTGVIQARGGAGGIPSAGNRGGGGGGGGGFVTVVSESVVAGAISGWTIDANGGAGGAGTGTGTAGTTGGNGTAVLLAH
jgi:hypothetical protein